MAIGTAAGLAAIYFGHHILGGIICAIALVIGIVSLTSDRIAELTHLWFTRFGQLVGRLVGIAFLAPLFLVGFTGVRLISLVSGNDPLQMRSKRKRSYWLPCDQEERKRRFTRSMFATESPEAARGGSLVPWLTAGLLLVVAGEVLLRLLGFGNAVLYTGHPTAGYFPAPHQRVQRLGGLVETNGWGMRAPEYTAEKPAGAVRILMLGDSTLYGGQYISNDQLYARLLERELQESVSSPVQVLNMGTNGWGPFNKFGYVRSMGSFGADLCIICLPTADFRRPLVPLWETPYFRQDAPPRLAYEEVLYHLNWRQRMKVIRAERRKDKATRQEQVRNCMQCYVDLADYLRDAGCEAMFEILPSRAASMKDRQHMPQEERHLADQFTKLLGPTGFSCGFPVGFLRERGRAEDLYHDSIHLDVQGHALYAHYLTERVRQTSTWRARFGTTGEARGQR
jgi:hypothetical protein